MDETPLHTALGLPLLGSEPGIVLATVGGGGKTTLLFALAQERASARADDSVSVLTTTTKFTVPKGAESVPIVLATNPLVRAAAIADVRGRGLPTVIVAGGRADRGRLRGVEPDWPAQALGVDGVSFVGVEADGSAGRAFKAPAEHEPMIPDRATHVVAVVGVEALGKPLESRWVHRAEQVMALTGASEGDAVTAAMIASVLTHPQGGRKGAAERAGFAVVVSRARADREGAIRSGAGAIGEACRAAGIELVVAWEAASATKAEAGWAERL